MSATIFEGLPGLASDDEPCFYETEAAPEEDEPVWCEESDAVEVIDISVEERFSRFRDKTLEPRRVDFSDRLRYQLNTGYVAASVDGDGRVSTCRRPPNESIVDRYERIVHELQQLEQHLTPAVSGQLWHQFSHGEEGTSTSDTGSADSQQQQLLLQHVRQLQLQVSQLDLQQQLNEKLAVLTTQSHAPLAQAVEKQLKLLQRPLPPAAAAAGGGDTCAVQLHVQVEQGGVQRSAQLVAVERRLARLEGVLGVTPEKISCLNAATRRRGLLAATVCLQSQLALLQPQPLQLACARLAALQQRLHSLLHQNTNSGQQQQQQQEEQQQQQQHHISPAKVTELLDLMKEVQPTQQQLPNILQRLQSLQHVQHQAVEIDTALARFQPEQMQLTASMDRCTAELQQLGNVTAASFKSVDQQLQQLQQRLQQLKQR